MYKADNSLIKDLEDFTTTFFRETLPEVLLKYSVFDVSNTLLVNAPGTFRIKLHRTHPVEDQKVPQSANWSKPESGGYVWYTTGSGKTLTSFKGKVITGAGRVIDKHFVDRKDLDYQTMKEHQRLSPTASTVVTARSGQRNLDKEDNKIVVTTTKKPMPNPAMKRKNDPPIHQASRVYFDECHRSHLAVYEKPEEEVQAVLPPRLYRTPIFQNASGA